MKRTNDKILTVFLLFGMALPALADNFYVAKVGDDANPGSLDQPWRTIQFALNQAKPGDKVFVRGGTYNERLRFNRSGTASGGAISLLNYPKERPVLDGKGLVVPDEDTGLIFIKNRSYLKVVGFELRNYQTSILGRVPVGIHVRGSSHHITLKGNKIHHIEHNGRRDFDVDAHGIAVYGDNAKRAIHHLVIDRNKLYRLTLGSSEALVVNGNVRDFKVTRNIIHDNNNIGIDAIGFEKVSSDPGTDQARGGLIADNTVYNIDSRGNPAYGRDPSAGGIYIDGGRDIIVERNIVHHSNIGIELASEHAGRSTSGIIVRNNFVYLNHVTGISLGGYNTRRGSTEACQIINNTLFQNDSLKWGNGELLLQYDTNNNLIKNNIFYANSQNLLIANPFVENNGNRLDNNIFFISSGKPDNGEWQWQKKRYYGFDKYRAGTGNDGNSLFVDPLLTKTGLPVNLHLQASSPAIGLADFSVDAGNQDIDRQPRNNGLLDIGADEVY